MSLDANSNTQIRKVNTLGFLKKHFFFTMLFIIIGSGIAFAMSEKPEDYCWRYKIKVEIDTPNGIKSGASVREACLSTFKGYNPQIADFKERDDGEAVVIDIGSGLVFGTVHSSNSIFYISHVFPGPQLFSIEGAKHYASLKLGLKAPLPLKDYPTFVSFKDLSVPETIQMVRGEIYDKSQKRYIPVDNFEEYFGKGVKLHSVTIETTNEAVNWGIRKWLPWLDEYYDKMLDGSSNNSLGAKNQVANSFAAGSFSTKRLKNER